MDTKKSARFQFVLQIRVYLFKMGRYCQQVYHSHYFNKNVPIDSLLFLNGDYDVYVDGKMLNATIDVENEFFEIGDWSLYGEEAIDAITEIYNFYRHSNNTVESAIEQYIYDALR